MCVCVVVCVVAEESTNVYSYTAWLSSPPFPPFPPLPPLLLSSSPPPPPQVCSVLLEHGAFVEAKGKAGVTPLHMAASMGHTDVMAVLLQHDADPDAIQGQKQPINTY